MGLDNRDVTPELASAIAFLAAEVRSFERTSIVISRVLKRSVSTSSIRRIATQVGNELVEIGNSRADREVVVPQAAVVSCDGGRIRTRKTGHGRGIRPSGDGGWRETKNASLERMMLPGKTKGADPCPELPTTFRSVEKVAKIVEKPVPTADMPPPTDADGKTFYQGPQRQLRTVLSSMANSNDFGQMMEYEARRRRFFESSRRAFLGDGLAWNWSIWKKHFPTFTPILDFIHATEYLFSAAMCATSNEKENWMTYVRYVTLCWQGRIDEVIDQLRALCKRRGMNTAERVADDDPNKPLTDGVRYLTNNRSRMNYPRYRQLGFPVTSSPMESLIKQINHRVKGTEMFWNDPDGAEAILRLRAAALSDDDRLSTYLTTRPGHPFVRRRTPQNAA